MILTYLKTGQKLTTLEAIYKFGCTRLASRVYDLREDGYNIKTKIVTKNGKSFAEYYLAEEGE